MLTVERQVKLFLRWVAMLLIFASGPALAVPVTFPSGKPVDLTPRQVELLKQSPGIYYLENRPPKITNEKLRHWALIELPQELGGGCLIGTSQNLARGFDINSVAVIEDTGLASTKTSFGAAHRPSEKQSPESANTGGIHSQNSWWWSFDAGYRIDDFDWSIAGNAPPAFGGNFVNVLSELTWSDLEIFQLELGIGKFFPNSILLKGSLSYGLIFDGENQDSDYAGDNRTLEFSRSNNGADDGETVDGSIGLGYHLPLLSDTFGITPLIGYSYNALHLKIRDGFQTIPPFGPFTGLNSSYDARWYGPWVGLELNAKKYGKNSLSPAHEFFIGAEYHWAEYEAEANWNLRVDLAHPKSFEHEADGTGIVFSAGYSYFFNPQWSLDFSGKYQKWETDPGIDRVFFADGTEAETRLNEVNWKSFSLTFGVTCRF